MKPNADVRPPMHARCWTPEVIDVSTWTGATRQWTAEDEMRWEMDFLVGGGQTPPPRPDTIPAPPPAPDRQGDSAGSPVRPQAGPGTPLLPPPPNPPRPGGPLGPGGRGGSDP